jgi:hypothetical protein
VFNVPLTRCPGVGEHRSPAPDWGPEAVRQEAAETDGGRPLVLGFSFPGLVWLARGAGHRPTCNRFLPQKTGTQGHYRRKKNLFFFGPGHRFELIDQLFPVPGHRRRRSSTIAESIGSVPDPAPTQSAREKNRFGEAAAHVTA